MNALTRDLIKLVDMTEEMMKEKEQKEGADYREKLHLMPPVGWLNDPNGLCQLNGIYHAFFQYSPFNAEGGVKMWGHYTSKDMIDWEYQGVKLYPDQPFDCHGVYSGSAFIEDDKMYVYYTGNVKLEDGDFDYINTGRESNTVLVVSEDGKTFGSKKELMRNVDYPSDLTCHVRDPKVWKDGDSYYMMMGSSYHDAGRVLFYTSKDGENWTYANQCRPESYGWTIECPDLFSQNDQWIFIGCPMRLTPGEKKYPDQAVWALAEFDPKTCELKLPDTHSYVDYGLDLYAPQTTLDAEGRRVMISWMRMPMAVTDSTDRPAWNGMMSSARVVEEKEGHLYFHMHPQVDAYLSAETTAEEAAESGKVFRIQTDLSEGETLNIGGYVISRSEGKVVGDRSAVLEGCDEVRTVDATPVIEGAAQLDILVNDHLIEIFVNDGQYVLSHVVYGKSKKISGKYEKVLVGK